MKPDNRKKIVISAVNFFEGGPLSILRDCLSHVNNTSFSDKFHIIALVHDENLFEKSSFDKIDFISYPEARKSYWRRLRLEFFTFYELSKKWDIEHWISLHDISPRLDRGVNQSVYCHNPSPFRKPTVKDFIHQPSLFFFSVFYKYLYKINIKRNKFVVVQQQWMRNEFIKMYGLNLEKVIVARPDTHKPMHLDIPVKSNTTTFFFPTLPRPFKNIEVICKAAKQVVDNGSSNFQVIITIDGSENKYSKSILAKYGHMDQMHFVGKVTRDVVYDYYSSSCALIFPSKLETWGMPLSEFKEFDKPIIASNLPYARETLGQYSKVKFFNPDDDKALAGILLDFVNKKAMDFDETHEIIYNEPFAGNWEDLFSILMRRNEI